MYIDSFQQDFDITKINCGFIFSDGTVYGCDDYQQGYRTHERILQHYGIKEEPGCIRFCLSFIMKESPRYLMGRYHGEYYEIPEEKFLTDIQFDLIKEWMHAQQGRITCPTIFDKSYQIRYLESLDKNLFENIISI